jgi:hypothetical protein
MIDRERLFQMLVFKQWDELFEQLYQQRQSLKQDAILRQVEQYAKSEFLSHLERLDSVQRVASTRHVCMLVQSDRKFFQAEFWKPLIETRLKAMFDTRDSALAGLANDFLHELELAAEILQRLQLERPEEFADARRSMMNVKAVERQAAQPAPRHVSSLFRSPQERHFFQALSTMQPAMLAYPNVPVSAVIPLVAIQNALTPATREYYYRAQFDCVLFDREEYLPRHFFELDSSFHNRTDAQVRDARKDEICRAAGVKLVRIRALDRDAASQHSFESLLADLLKQLPADN